MIAAEQVRKEVFAQKVSQAAFGKQVVHIQEQYQEFVNPMDFLFRAQFAGVFSLTIGFFWEFRSFNSF